MNRRGIWGAAAGAAGAAGVAAAGAAGITAPALARRATTPQALVLAAEPSFLVFVLGLGVVVRAASDNGLADAARAVLPAGEALPAAVALAQQLAALPQLCLRQDRASVLEQWGLPHEAAMANEWDHGMRSLTEAAAGAARFASGGEGRHGAGGEGRHGASGAGAVS